MILVRSHTVDPSIALLGIIFFYIIVILISMSRHKLVKALDLDEELDDYDGGAESDFDEGVGPEDRGKFFLESKSWRILIRPVADH